MGRKLSFFPDEEPEELIRRYESLKTRKGVTGYFDVEELEQIVDYYLRKGKPNESTGALELGLKLHPDNPMLMVKRAKIYLATGEALKAYRILESTPVSSEYEVFLLRIEALIQLDRNKEAAGLCEKVIENEMTDKDVICLDIAYIFLSQFEIETALKFLVKGEEINPRNTDLLFELAFCREQLHQNEEAIVVYQKILKVDPYAAEAWFNLGQVYFSQNNYAHALKAYDYALVINPDDSLTCLQKAHCHFQLNQYKEALNEYFIYEKMVSDNWQTYLFIGECYERTELYDEAIQYYFKSLAEFPDNYEALTGIGICLLEQEKYAESMKYIQKALLLNDEAADAWVYLAEGLTGIDDTSGALQAYMKSIQLEPDQPETLMAIANICMEDAEYQVAILYYEEALSKDKNRELENIHLFMAIAYYKTGDEISAFKSLGMAMEESLDAEKVFYELCPEAGK
jgi:tetratricopeptide (TPR) repeat protein